MMTKAITDKRPVVNPSDEYPSAVTPGMVIAGLGAAIAGAVLAGVIAPAVLPLMVQSLLGAEPKAYWYMTRASALVAFVLLWISMLLGLMMTNKLARAWPGGPTAFSLHQHTSLLALGFAVFHGLILLGDQYIGYTLGQVLVPFSGATYKPLWVGIGQVGIYLLTVVGLSFYARRQITQRVWRLIHFASFAMFIMALAHGIFSGTDSSVLPVQIMYLLAAASTAFMTIYRIIVARMK
jgi:predicted ferric reductase